MDGIYTFTERSVLDPESREASNCHVYQFFKICLPLWNKPIGLTKKAILNVSLVIFQERLIVAGSHESPEQLEIRLRELESSLERQAEHITVASETLEGMFFLDYSVNMTHRKAMIGTKVKNYLCDLFQ